MAFHTLAIGTSALLTSRYGLDVTGQNLGNVDTPGYSRQRLNQAATKGWTATLGTAVVGTGVWTQSIKRIADEYAEKQLRQSTSTNEYYGNLQYCYSNIQTYFDELSKNANSDYGNALSDSMLRFWNSMGDFSTHVESLSSRKTTVVQAGELARRFNSLGNQLSEYRKDVDNQVKESEGVINQLIDTIAQLNKSIVTTELGGVTNRVANDLRDQRGEAVKKLYEYMDVDVVEEKNGSYIVSLHGRNLVYYDQVEHIMNEKTPSDDGTMVNTPVFASDHYPVRPRDGKLAAQLEMRDVIIKGYKDDINKLAANFIWEFNRAYSQTRGLESFDTLTSLNAPTNPQDTLNKLDYNDNVVPGTFQIVNGNFEIIVHNRNDNKTHTVNIEVDLDGRPGPGGEPDMILWDPDNPTASNSLINRMQKELDEQFPGAFEVSIDRHYQVTITSKDKDYGFCFGKDTSGVLAALGLNVFFTGFNAQSMGINEALLDNPSLMGGSYTFNKGDNDGIIDLLNIRDKALGNLSEMTLDTFYESVAGRLGSEASKTSNLKSLSDDVLSRMYNQRESISGVNEDEEVTKMITYQRAFQSAAKFISTVDQLYETLINM